MIARRTERARGSDIDRERERVGGRVSERKLERGSVGEKWRDREPKLSLQSRGNTQTFLYES